MSIFDGTSEDDLDFLTQEEKLKRAQLDIDNLRKLKQGAPMEEVGGYTLSTGQKMPGLVSKTPWISNYGPALAAGLGGFMQGGQDKARADLTRREVEGLNDYMKQSAQGTQTSDNPEEILEGGMPNKAVYTPPTDEQRLADAVKGLSTRNPLVIDTAKKQYEDLIVKAPERAQQRLENKSKLEQQLIDKERNRILQGQIASQADATKRYGIDTNKEIKMAGLDKGKSEVNSMWRRKGVKANEIKTENAANGDLILTDKLDPSDVIIVPAGGKASADFIKDHQTRKKNYENAQDAVEDLPALKDLAKLATGSLVGDYKNKVLAAFNIPDNPGLAVQSLNQAAANMIAQLDRMPGAQSDADVIWLRERLGNFGGARTPSEIRVQSLNEMERRLNRVIKRYTDDDDDGTSNRPAGARVVGQTGGAAPAPAPAAKTPAAPAVKDEGPKTVNGVEYRFAPRYGVYYSTTKIDGKYKPLQ